MGYRVSATFNQQVTIDNLCIIDILTAEIGKVLGDKEYHIEDGIIMHEYKWHTWLTDTIGPATPEQIKTYEGLCVAMEYFRAKHDKSMKEG